MARLSDEAFDRRVQERLAQLEVQRQSGLPDLETYVRQKRRLGFDHLRRGRATAAVGLQRELCRELHALQAQGYAVDLEKDIHSYVGMARDSGSKPWDVAATVAEFGYAVSDPFEVDALFEGVGFDEQALGLPVMDLMALVRAQSQVAGFDPDRFLTRVDFTLVNHGVRRRAAADVVAFLAHRMGVTHQMALSLPVGSGLLGSDDELGQCLVHALGQVERYDQALAQFEAELRRRGADGEGLDQLMHELRAQFLLA